MVFNLFSKVAGQPLGNRGLKIRPLDAAFFEEFALVTEIAGSRLIRLPSQRLLPIGPILSAGTLPIGQGQQHERVDVFLRVQTASESSDSGRILYVSSLSRLGKSEMMVHEQDKTAAAFGRKL